jgi:thiol-disulfide isomerase/thioredoxin
MFAKRIKGVLGGCLTLGLLLAGAGPALAQADKDAADNKPKKPEVTLKAGDKAPPIKVEKWVKGAPVTKFEPGKIYVVEFWATWCGPCRVSMPHLSEMQAAYKDKGVTFIGTNVWEPTGGAKYTDETLTKVEDFVKEQGDVMAYTVAYDGGSKVMADTYMTAAGQNGIPASFLIDKTGKIAWIGHPMYLELPLEALLAGETNPEALAASAKKAQELKKAAS